MNITFNQLKTFYSALKNKMKGFRGNWNQNDPTSDDYIKNRPFYSEVKEYIIIDNLSSINYSNGKYPRCNFVLNQSYDIIWNGTLYKNVVCAFDDPYHFLGGSNSNYPFYIDDNGGNDLYVEGEEDWTLSILTTQELVHKINPKYVPLPEGIATEEDVWDILDNNLSSVAWTGSYNDLYDQPTIYTDVVRTGTAQSLSDTQKARARDNIGAGTGTSNFSGNYDDLENRPVYSVDEGLGTTYLAYKGELTAAPNGIYSSVSGKTVELPPIGHIYQIQIGDQIYEAKLMQGSSDKRGYFGNKNIRETGSAGEDFYIDVYESAGNMCLYTLHVRPAPNFPIITSFSVIEKLITYHQLDENYIPDTIARVSDLQNILPEATTDDNGKVLGIADGEWTKVAMNEGVSQEYVDNAIAQKSQVQMITWEADD